MTACSPASVVRRLPLLCLFAAGCSALAGQAGQDLSDAQDSRPDLANASIEQLMELEVVTVTRGRRPVSRTAAAIHVITAEDIRRSGARNIPDLFRGVPGMQVAQVDTHTWAVSARGFNGAQSNKLLVMVDGRSVYTPMAGAVYWDNLDLPLDEIERIEVIRGPGGSMWGANAANGIINIITRSSRDTTGGRVVAGGGTGGASGWTSARFGGRAGSRTWYRVSGSSRLQTPLEPVFPGAQPLTQSHRIGFRMDRDLDGGASLMLVGDAIGGTTAQKMNYVELMPSVVADEGKRSGGFLQARLTKPSFSGGSRTIQAYFDRQVRSSDGLQPQISQADLDYQQNALAGAHNILFGGGIRVSESSLRSKVLGPRIAREERMTLLDTFAQDEFAIGDALVVTAGAKIEYNSWAGAALQPAIRLMWTPAAKVGLWAAASRAVRTPSRAERQMQVLVERGTDQRSGIPYTISLTGDPNFGYEKLSAWETGFRAEISRSVSVDIAAFYNRMSALALGQALPPVMRLAPTPSLEIPLVYVNDGRGRSVGVESALNWNPRGWLRLQGTYSWLNIRLHGERVQDPFFILGKDRYPQHSGSFRAAINLPWRMELDAAVHGVGQMQVNESGRIPGYARLDLRYGWKITRSWEASVSGQDLGERRHMEFRAESQIRAMQPGRRVFAELRWAF